MKGLNLAMTAGILLILLGVVLKSAFCAILGVIVLILVILAKKKIREEQQGAVSAQQTDRENPVLASLLAEQADERGQEQPSVPPLQTPHKWYTEEKPHEQIDELPLTPLYAHHKCNTEEPPCVPLQMPNSTPQSKSPEPRTAPVTRSASDTAGETLCGEAKRPLYAVSPPSSRELRYNGSFYYSFAEGVACVERYKGDEQAARVPDKLGGYPVACIRENAFCGCMSLRSVSLPESVQRIENDAFTGCESLCCISVRGDRSAVLKTAKLPRGVTMQFEKE